MAYTREWYEKNKEKIGDRRKERYHSDPEYRQRVLAHARSYREQKKAEREAFLKNPTITIDGVTVPAMTVDAMLDEIGIDKPRLKYLQKAGYLPPALITRPLRLYTKRQAAYLKHLESFLAEHSAALRAGQDVARQKLDVITTVIHENWRKT